MISNVKKLFPFCQIYSAYDDKIMIVLGRLVTRDQLFILNEMGYDILDSLAYDGGHVIYFRRKVAN